MADEGVANLHMDLRSGSDKERLVLALRPCRKVMSDKGSYKGDIAREEFGLAPFADLGIGRERPAQLDT